MIFKVTFRWHGEAHWCANICVARTEKEAVSHYENDGHVVTEIHEVRKGEFNECIAKGMPVIDIENEAPK